MNLRLKLFGKLIIFLTVSSVFLSPSAHSQEFIKLENVEMAGAYLGMMSWCDFTSDGYPDLLICGSDYGTPLGHAGMYINNGDKTFTLSEIDYLQKLIYGDIAWGDMDNDGLPDLLYAGTTSGFTEDNHTWIYRNSGNGEFDEILHEVPNLSRCYLEWVDIDNDGWNDIYYQGINADNEFDLGIFKNLKNNQFENVEINIEKITGPRGNATVNQATWADFDNDGLKDVAISMSSQLEFDFVFYKNLGGFNFELVDIGIPSLNYVRQKAGDFNQDGLMDLAFTGSDKLSLSSVDWQADFYFYINQGNLEFSEDFKIDNIGIFWTTVDAVDYTNDGFSDIMVYGTASDFLTIRYFVNNQDGTFIDMAFEIEGAEEGSGWFADIDADHDADLAVTGRFAGTDDYEATFVYENQSLNINQPPQPPDTIQIFATGDDLYISWNEGTDDMTNPGSLFYNLQIGTMEVPTSLISACAMDGSIKIYNNGNLNLNNAFNYQNFPEGDFQIEVQAIDHAFNGSQFSTPLEFCFKHSSHFFADTTNGCFGDSVLLYVEGDYQDYLWNTGSTDSAIYVHEDGFFNVNLTDSEGCLSSETTWVKFYEKPVMSLGPDTTITTIDTLVIYPDTLYQSIVWSDGSEADSLLIIGNEFDPGTYDIWATVSNPYGCTCTDTISVTISQYISVDEIRKNDGFSIYPNPANKRLHIVSDNSFTASCILELQNISGGEILIKAINFTAGRASINLPEVEPGIYLLKLIADDHCFRKKLIIN